MDLEGAVDDLLASGAEDDHNESGPEDDLLGDYTQALQLEDKVGDEIQPQLATLLTNMLTKKAEESALNKKADLYPRPSNVPAIVTPTVNEEIWGHIQKPCRSHDIKFQKAQSNNIKGLGALAKLASTLLEAKSNKTTVSASQCLRMCLDAFTLLASGNQELNNRRKEAIVPDLNTKFKNLAKNQPVTNKLFGDDLSQQVKNINETAKMSRSMAKGGGRSNYNKGKGSYPAKNWGDSDEVSVATTTAGVSRRVWH